MKFKNFLYKNYFHKLKTLISLVIFSKQNKTSQEAYSSRTQFSF